MDPIYVTGHRNPDTDSIVSAMAYAALQNALGNREYVAARLGHISDETKLVLDRFGFEPPVRIQTMRTQVQDLDYDTPPALSRAVTISRAWKESGTKILTLDDQTRADIREASQGVYESIKENIDPAIYNAYMDGIE